MIDLLRSKAFVSALLGVSLSFMLSHSKTAQASSRVCGDDLVWCLFSNLTGVDPFQAELQTFKNFYQAQLDAGNSQELALEATAKEIASNVAEFQTVRLKSFAEPWTHKDGDLGSPLNDTILTIIKMIVDEQDFRRILYDDIIAVATGTPKDADKLVLADGTEIPQYYNRSNDHFQALENAQVYHKPGVVVISSQSPATHKNPSAIAGILSQGGFGRAAFLAGTNRRAIPMLLREATCHELDEIKDTSGTEKYILRDVTRIGSDGVKEFKNNCKGCHSFMDQIAPAFAYYEANAGDVSGIAVVYDEPLEVTSSLPPSNKMMKVVSAIGYIPKNDEWRAEFTDGQITSLGWPNDPNSKKGFGAKELGRAFANSGAFASCQPKRAFKAVCGNPTEKDAAFLELMKKEFTENGYNLKSVFLKSAVYCAGGQK